MSFQRQTVAVHGTSALSGQVGIGGHPETPPRALRLRRTAMTMLFFGGAGVATTLALGMGHWPEWWAMALVHGLEGALVGGLCDWFAVEKTYHAVKKNRDRVADGLGFWVASELLSGHVIRQRLMALLDDPEVRRKAYEWVDTKLGSEHDTGDFVADLWSRIETPVVEYVTRYDLSATELGIAGHAFQDEAVIAAVGRCLGSALIASVNSGEFEHAVAEAKKHQGLVTKFGFNRMKIPEKVTEFATRLRDEPLTVVRGSGGLGGAIAQTVGVGVSAFIEEWNRMDLPQRSSVVQAVLRHLRQPVIAAIARFLVRERDHLRKAESLRHHPRAKQLADFVERYVTQGISDALGGFVTQALKRQPAEETAARLRFQTEEHLTWIRINGTGLGFAIGGVIGLVRAVASL